MSIFVSSILCFALWSLPLKLPDPKSVEFRGMVATWSFQEDGLLVNLSSPRQGWVAIGFNDRPGLTGTNLIMAAVVGGELRLEDQFIVAPGKHPSVTELGGTSRVEPLEGHESPAGTEVSFRLAPLGGDKFHQALNPGKPVYLLLAYSLEDDFGHHSVARTTLQQIL